MVKAAAAKASRRRKTSTRAKTEAKESGPNMPLDEAVAETYYTCGRCDFVKKLVARLVPERLMCTKCGNICEARIKQYE